MAFETYHLSDIDGTVHVRCESPDYSRPVFVSVYWPTNVSTRDLMALFECDSVEGIETRSTMPGEVWAVNPSRHGVTGVHIIMTHGAKTQSVKTTERDYPPPTKRCRTEYRNGRWFKEMKRGWVCC